MKIAILSPRKSGLSETFIQAQVERLEGTIIQYHGGENPTHLGDVALSEMVALPKRLFNKVARQLGMTDLSYQEYIFKASLQKEKPDLILAQYGVLGAKNLRVIKSLNIPLIVHFHGYDASVYSVLEGLAKEYKEMFAYAKATIGVSHKMVAMLKEAGAPDSKLHYLCYGPNPNFANVQPNYHSKIFFGLGRFVDKKAPHLTIMAFQKVLEKHPDAQLRMVGNGPLFHICKDIVKHYKLENNVHFLGAHGIDVVISEMEKACAFVQHSRRADNGDMEGTPVAILEAQMAGLPVISTKHAGIPDVVKQGITGLLVDENDVNGMAENMIQILDHPNFAQQLGSAAKPYILENYSMEKYIASLQAIVNQSALKH